MQLSAILALASAALAAAAPTKRTGTPQVTLNINKNPLTAPKQNLEQVDVVIGELTSLNQVHASEISFAFGGAIEVDVDTVQCRAYKDVYVIFLICHFVLISWDSQSVELHF
jgi:hypothetical protein